MHKSLIPIGELIAAYRPHISSAGSGDLWQLNYSIVPISAKSLQSINSYDGGTASISKKGKGELSVELTTLLSNRKMKNSQKFVSRQKLDPDHPGVLRNWECMCGVYLNGQPDPQTRNAFWGKVSGKTVSLNYDRAQKYTISHALYSFWSLLELIPTLSADESRTLTLLEGGEMIKEPCLLSSSGTTTAVVGGKPIELEGWVLTGRGIHPTWFWKEKGGPVLFIAATTVFYVLTGEGLAVGKKPMKPMQKSAAKPEKIVPKTSEQQWTITFKHQKFGERTKTITVLGEDERGIYYKDLNGKKALLVKDRIIKVVK
ncbi:hypothetical protein PDESU_02091 [Pontiella desulfatans]|uniref:Uncharacterized protein n=1 Tax=Pontiella desulfatans TaxID=2750659 RepID=A0A6C2U1K0_PONDE|nr:hypothetical protein [Pontiella desulfatans]VGO13534.1 hypothetical protein PDESU_02091 [Pontiella desulfatans]